MLRYSLTTHRLNYLILDEMLEKCNPSDGPDIVHAGIHLSFSGS
jgi:hypothetical protein